MKILRIITSSVICFYIFERILYMVYYANYYEDTFIMTQCHRKQLQNPPQLSKQGLPASYHSGSVESPGVCVAESQWT